MSNGKESNGIVLNVEIVIIINGNIEEVIGEVNENNVLVSFENVLKEVFGEKLKSNGVEK